MPDTPARPPSGMEGINGLTAASFVSAFGDLFEHSPWVAVAVARSRPFTTARMMHDAMIAHVRQAAPDDQLALVRAHPGLAGQEAADGVLTADSTVEQSRLGFTRLTRADAEDLAGLNLRYRERYGFPCIVALARHATRESVVEAMRRRLPADPSDERATAIQEIGHITAARLAGRLGRTGGALSIHALDISRGGPAPDLAFELHRNDGGGWRCLAARRTDAGGRTGGPLLSGLDMEPAAYRIDYHVGDYHRAQGEGGSFLDIVPIAFRISEPGVHYHIPIQFTPWAYATYRGS